MQQNLSGKESHMNARVFEKVSDHKSMIIDKLHVPDL